MEIKSNKTKRIRNDIKQVESEGESANFQGIEKVDGSKEESKFNKKSSKSKVVESEGIRSKKRNWKSGVLVRKSGRVTRKSIRLREGEEEG